MLPGKFLKAIPKRSDMVFKAKCALGLVYYYLLLFIVHFYMDIIIKLYCKHICSSDFLYMYLKLLNTTVDNFYKKEKKNSPWVHIYLVFYPHEVCIIMYILEALTE